MVYRYSTVIPFAWSPAVLPIMPKNEPVGPDFNFLQFLFFFLFVDLSYHDACKHVYYPYISSPTPHTNFRTPNIDISAIGYLDDY